MILVTTRTLQIDMLGTADTIEGCVTRLATELLGADPIIDVEYVAPDGDGLVRAVGLACQSAPAS